jgi:transposase
MSEKRRRFSASFKAEVALEAIRCKSTVNEIASKRSVHPNQVVAWKKQAVESLTDAFTDRRKRPGKEEEETNQLYEQIGRLKVEVDWLKKKFSA